MTFKYTDFALLNFELKGHTQENYHSVISSVCATMIAFDNISWITMVHLLSDLNCIRTQNLGELKNALRCEL